MTSSTIIDPRLDNNSSKEGQRPSHLSSRIPLCCALLAYWGSICFLFFYTKARTEGTFTYAIDDAYIHLAIARNVALHHTWGINPHEFAAATSSPFWTLLLSVLYRPVRSDLVPLFLNVIFGSVAIAQASAVLRRYRIGSIARTLLLLLFVFVVPMPVLTVMGMEHLLQIVAVIAFLDAFGRFCEGNGSTQPNLRWLWALSFLLPIIRYEALVMLAASVLYLLYGKRFRAATGIVLFSAMSTLAFGIYFVHYGGMMLPNSVLVKAVCGPMTRENGASLVDQIAFFALMRLGFGAFLIALFALAVGALVTLRRSDYESMRYDRAVVTISAIMLGIQLLLNSDTFSVRYEAYVVAVGLLWPMAIVLQRLSTRLRAESSSPAFGTILQLGMLPVTFWLLGGRAVTGFQVATFGPSNIHDQQVQMAKFVRTNYPGKTVAINDIGCVCYFGDVRCLDLVGLANNQVARMRLHGSFHTDQVEAITRANAAPVAMIYDHWFNHRCGALPDVPKTWRKIGVLRISNNVICGQDRVTFYATSASNASDLAARLRRFSTDLPRTDHIVMYR